MFRYLTNLSAAEAVECAEPWALTRQRPSFPNKEAYRLWCNHPTTDHVFLSGFEGRIPGLRVSELNPPVRMYGLFVDYDANATGDVTANIVANAPAGMHPAYYCRTFSQHIRTLYVFEGPVPLFTTEIAKEFVGILSRELKLDRQACGLDKPALGKPDQYYELGDGWVEVIPGNTRVLPLTALMAWVTKAADSANWAREGVAIPIPAIRDEIIRRFPDASWPGGWDMFDLGARGPRFWDQDASDPTAALVRETGMQYFSDGGGFITWEGIFGASFVRRFLDDRIGTIIRRFAFDGRDFWEKRLATGAWSVVQEKHLREDLKIKDLLNSKEDATVGSEVSRAVSAVRNMQLVTAALPLVYHPDGVIQYEGTRILNVSTRRPVAPVQDLGDWGVGFPKIAAFLMAVFEVDGDAESRQLAHFLAWLRHWYLGALEQSPRRGLALFLCGPTNAGKNLLNKAIIGGLMGGSESAEKHMLDGDKFNDRLLSVAHWRIDDAVCPNDPQALRKWSQMVKNIVANDRQVHRRMYSSGFDIEWLGRLVVTLNDDPESLRVVPQIDISILDKIMLLKMRRPSFDGWEMSDEEIERELPYLGAFLRDFTPPEHTRPDRPRFGVQPYHHPALLAAAESTDESSSFEEVLRHWCEDWFATGGPGSGDSEWLGNPTELLLVMERNDRLKGVIARNFPSAAVVGRRLNQMVNKGSASWVSRTGNRRYRIVRPQNDE